MTAAHTPPQLQHPQQPTPAELGEEREEMIAAFLGRLDELDQKRGFGTDRSESGAGIATVCDDFAEIDL